uniref:Anosmin-1 n=1 Tax=Meloidogyne incognita TaxID=6306 RepID=A0A914L1Z2_MELIC
MICLVRDVSPDVSVTLRQDISYISEWFGILGLTLDGIWFAPSCGAIFFILINSHCFWNNAETRRLLRHQISNLCKEDLQCSSCLIPCRELILNYELCDQTFCGEAPEPNHCRQSCTFIQNAVNRSGHCPKLQTRQWIADTECSAFCDSDTDCAEIEKCCSFGCSRTCLVPKLNDSRLLPMPEGITVQERKRKRSAILRWVMKRMTPQHTSTYANLFVIQWRWSLNKDPETMTPWQTVMVRNKMYAILKHLLTPGRYYLFRVAAVNVYGTYGFSQPSHPPFKLTKEVKSPSPPNNFTVLPLGDDIQSNTGEVAKIGWSPPISDIPIKDYRLSWWKTSLELAKVFELRQRRSSKGHDEDDYDGTELSEIDQEPLRRSLVLPSSTTKTQINGLEQNQVYIVELLATVDTSEGELRGEPAVLFLKTGATFQKKQSKNNSHVENLLPFSNEKNDFVEQSKNHQNLHYVAQVKTPFFEGNHLKTIISWNDHPSCNDNKLLENQLRHQFRVFVRSMRCLNQLPPQEFYVHNCVATLENLQFQCEYYVRIESYIVNEDQQRLKNSNENLIARLTFSTLPCEQTLSDIPLPCKSSEDFGKRINWPYSNSDKLPALALPLNAETTTRSTKLSSNTGREWLPIEELIENSEGDKNNKEISTIESSKRLREDNEKWKKSAENSNQQDIQRLNCLATSLSTADCSWTWQRQFEPKNNHLIGFRTVLSSTLFHTPSKVAIVGPEQRIEHLTDLNPKAVYRFRLQAITSLGLGAELVEHFSTGHLAISSFQSSNPEFDSEMSFHIGASKINGLTDEQYPSIMDLPWNSDSSTLRISITHNLRRAFIILILTLICLFNCF